MHTGPPNSVQQSLQPCRPDGLKGLYGEFAVLHKPVTWSDGKPQLTSVCARETAQLAAISPHARAVFHVATVQAQEIRRMHVAQQLPTKGV